MIVSLEYSDFWLIRTAARRWVKQNLDNPNSEQVLAAIQRHEGNSTWELTTEESADKRRPTKGEAI